MALSTPPPPPPPDPPSATATTTTTSTNAAGPVFSNQTRPPTPQSHTFSHYPPTQPHLPPSSNQLLYPVASSGRGFLPKPSSNYPNRPVVSYTGSRPPFGLTHMDPGQGAGVKSTHLQHALIGSSPTSAAPAGVIKGFPVVSSSHLKIASTHPSISDCNGLREGRDRTKEDTFVTIRDRKVRMSDNASLYTLCRSWLRNGLPDDTQPQYLDGVRSLPRPLPLAPQDAESPVEKEGDKEDEEDGGSVEHLSHKELLQRHVKRAKRVRSRLREERLRRIARYKARLALLLPPMVEQQFKNDPSSGN